LQIENENLAIADLAGIGGFFDRLDSLIKNVVLDGRFGPFCRPNPLTSVTVMPCTPMADNASRTSSSLNGLMTALTSFMLSPCFDVGSSLWPDLNTSALFLFPTAVCSLRASTKYLYKSYMYTISGRVRARLCTMMVRLGDGAHNAGAVVAGSHWVTGTM
jgi:hypothetical protein